jgi:hypothetical protein
VVKTWLLVFALKVSRCRGGDGRGSERLLVGRFASVP